MAKQKVNLSSGIYDDEQPGAIEKLTGAAPKRTDMDEPLAQAATPPTPEAKNEPEQTRKQTRNLKPTSMYLTPAQLRKLDKLAFQYNEERDERINRNDIVRHLVEKCTMRDLGDLDPKAGQT